LNFAAKSYKWRSTKTATETQITVDIWLYRTN